MRTPYKRVTFWLTPETIAQLDAIKDQTQGCGVSEHKTIRIRIPHDFKLRSPVAVQPVCVNWFPQLTEDQIVANALAFVSGQPIPHPDPNLITVEVEWA